MFKGKAKDRSRDDDGDSYPRQASKPSKPGASGRFWRPAPYATVLAAGQFLDGTSPNELNPTTHHPTPKSRAKSGTEAQRNVGYGTEMLYVDETGILWRDVEEKQEYTHLLSEDSIHKRQVGWDQFNDGRSSSSTEGQTAEDEDLHAPPKPLETNPRRQRVSPAVRRERPGAAGIPSSYAFDPISASHPNTNPVIDSAIALPLPLPPPHAPRTRSGSRVVHSSSQPPKQDSPRPATTSSPEKANKERIQEAREDFLKSSFKPPPTLFTSTSSPVTGAVKSPMAKTKADRRMSSPAGGFIPSSEPKFGGIFQRRGSLAPTAYTATTSPFAPPPRRPGLVPALQRSLLVTEKARLPGDGDLRPVMKKQSTSSLRGIFRKASFF